MADKAHTPPKAPKSRKAQELMQRAVSCAHLKRRRTAASKRRGTNGDPKASSEGSPAMNAFTKSFQTHDAQQQKMNKVIAAHRRAQNEVDAIIDYMEEIEVLGDEADLRSSEAELASAAERERAAAIEFLAARSEVLPSSPESELAREYTSEARAHGGTIDQTWEMPRAWIMVLRDHYCHR